MATVLRPIALELCMFKDATGSLMRDDGKPGKILQKKEDVKWDLVSMDQSELMFRMCSWEIIVCECNVDMIKGRILKQGIRVQNHRYVNWAQRCTEFDNGKHLENV